MTIYRRRNRSESISKKYKKTKNIVDDKNIRKIYGTMYLDELKKKTDGDSLDKLTEYGMKYIKYKNRKNRYTNDTDNVKNIKDIKDIYFSNLGKRLLENI